MNLFKLLSDTSVYSILLPLIPALYFFKQHEKPMRVLAIFISVSTCFDLYSLVTAKLGINNLNVLHIYTVIEYSFIAYFFSTLYVFQKIRVPILISIIIFSISSLYYSFFIANIFQFNSIPRTTECLLLFIIALYYSYKLFEHEDYVSLIKYPYFWVTAGILLYFGGNMVNFALYKFILTTSSPESGRDFWNVHSLLNIQANIFYFIAFLWSPRQPK